MYSAVGADIRNRDWPSLSNQLGSSELLVNIYLVEHQHQCLALDVHHRSAAAIIDDHPSLSAPAAIV